MIKHAANSGLFKNMDTIAPVINQEIFKPRDKDKIKAKFGLNGSFVLFTGSVEINEDRKGFKYLVDAIKDLYKKASLQLKDVVLIIAGNSDIDLQSFFDIKVIKTGRLPFETLAEYYAMADIYLSPTIQDAGPMMINQALMCGTPVIAFSMGAACDLITNDTGYLAAYKNSEDFGYGISRILNLQIGERSEMSKKCREMALAHSSYKAFEKRIVEIYNKVK